MRLELDRAADRQEGFVRAREVLARTPDSPERHEALRLLADRLDLPARRSRVWRRQVRRRFQRTRRSGCWARVTGWSATLWPRASRTESVSTLLAELGAEHFDVELYRRFHATLANGAVSEPELVALRAELDAVAEQAHLDDQAGRQLVFRLRERRLRRDLDTASAAGDLARVMELQGQLVRRPAGAGGVDVGGRHPRPGRDARASGRSSFRVPTRPYHERVGATRVRDVRRNCGTEGLSPVAAVPIRETMDPVHYLAASYYERWEWSNELRLVRKGTIAAGDVDAWVERLRAGEHPPALADAGQAERVLREIVVETPELAPADERRFRPGDRVRVRRMRPAGTPAARGTCVAPSGSSRRSAGWTGCRTTARHAASRQPVYAVAFRSDDAVRRERRAALDGLSRPVGGVPGAGMTPRPRSPRP